MYPACWRGPTDGRRLIVPLYNARGELRSLQFISIRGTKRYLFGGEKAGCCTKLPTGGASLRFIVICEGWATGASLYEATGLPVLVALDADKLGHLSWELNDGE